MIAKAPNSTIKGVVSFSVANRAINECVSASTFVEYSPLINRDGDARA